MHLILFAIISFGEMQLSNLTVFILILLTVSTFASVVISSLKLIQSAVNDDK